MEVGKHVYIQPKEITLTDEYVYKTVQNTTQNLNHKLSDIVDEKIKVSELLKFLSSDEFLLNINIKKPLKVHLKSVEELANHKQSDSRECDSFNPRDQLVCLYGSISKVKAILKGNNITLCYKRD